MRILVLHGFGQTGAVMRHRCEKIWTTLRTSGVATADEVVFPDGPFEASQLSKDGAAVQGRSWFHLNPADPNNAGIYLMRSISTWIGAEQSLAALQALGRFDAVIGFSQGAAIAACVAGTVGARKLVLIAGSAQPAPDNAALLGLFDRSLDSLHCYGLADPIIGSAESRAQAALYARSRCFEHAAGHVIPTTAPFKDCLLRFLQAA